MNRISRMICIKLLAFLKQQQYQRFFPYTQQLAGACRITLQRNVQRKDSYLRKSKSQKVQQSGYRAHIYRRQIQSQLERIIQQLGNKFIQEETIIEWLESLTLYSTLFTRIKYQKDLKLLELLLLIYNWIRFKKLRKIQAQRQQSFSPINDLSIFLHFILKTERYNIYIQMIQSDNSEITLNDEKRKNRYEFFELNKLKLFMPTKLKKVTCVTIYENTIYIGTRQSKLYIYHIKSNSLLTDQHVITPHCQVLSSVIANEDIFFTIAESDDQMPIIMWNAKTKMFITAIKNHKSQISKLIILSNPNWIASSSWDCTVKIWSIGNVYQWQQSVKQIKCDYPVLTVNQVIKDIVAFGGDDCFINFYNWKTLQFLGKCFAHAGSTTLIYSSSLSILTAGGDHKIKEWRVKQIKAQPSAEIKSEKKNGVQYGENSFVELVRQNKINYDSSIFVVDLTDQKQLLVIDRHGVKLIHQLEGQIINSDSKPNYSQGITGIAKYQDAIFVTTTKGQVECYQIKLTSKQQAIVFQQQLQPDN